MTDTSEWVRTYLDPQQDPAEVAASLNRLASARGLPMPIPVPAARSPRQGVQSAVNAIVVEPRLHALWMAQSATVQPKRKPRPKTIRRSASGMVRGGEARAD